MKDSTWKRVRAITGHGSDDTEIDNINRRMFWSDVRGSFVDLVLLLLLALAIIGASIAATFTLAGVARFGWESAGKHIQEHGIE